MCLIEYILSAVIYICNIRPHNVNLSTLVARRMSKWNASSTKCCLTCLLLYYAQELVPQFSILRHQKLTWKILGRFQTKKNKGVISGGRGSQGVGSFLRNHRSRNLSCINSRTNEPHYGLKILKQCYPYVYKNMFIKVVNLKLIHIIRKYFWSSLYTYYIVQFRKLTSL